MSTWVVGIRNLLTVVTYGVLSITSGCALIATLQGYIELSDAQIAGLGIFLGYFSGKLVTATTRSD